MIFDHTLGKTMEPDECILNKNKKHIIILEKKYQQGSGSVDEKIQTGVCKRWQYEKIISWLYY